MVKCLGRIFDFIANRTLSSNKKEMVILTTLYDYHGENLVQANQSDNQKENVAKDSSKTNYKLISQRTMY